MTPTASGAPDADKTQLWVVFLTLRITTPFTSQGTALHEDEGSDPGPIVERESLDMGYISPKFLMFADHFTLHYGMFITIGGVSPLRRT